MIAADTSAWVDYSKGVESSCSKHLEAAIFDGSLTMPAPVLFEILSAPGLTKEAEKSILELPRLEITTGFWDRAGRLRRAILKIGLKARSMDCLIAQNCIDHGIGLIASDRDFRHYLKFGLKIV
ncbi:MAG: hypothetical protein C5B49_11300 [Bdellovibrio sp.]|nr:MAG: hypothetical protein C5B49_11300 [Bdellovibrio sp.]